MKTHIDNTLIVGIFAPSERCLFNPPVKMFIPTDLMAVIQEIY